MNIVSYKVSPNSSRVTIDSTPSEDALGYANELAKAYGIKLSHNMTCGPITDAKGDITWPKSFGSIVWIGGLHERCMLAFVKKFTDRVC